MHHDDNVDMLCTWTAEGEAVLVVTEIVAVGAAAAVVECQAVLLCRVEEPANLGAAALTLGDRSEAVSRRVGASLTVDVGAPVVALGSRAERVRVAAAAAVRERATLGLVGAPVEPQDVVEARTRVLRQPTRFCRKKKQRVSLVFANLLPNSFISARNFLPC